jgi:hypothetical protein
MRPLLFCLAGLAALTLTSPAAFAAPAEHDIDGTVILNNGFGNEGEPCAGTGQYADITAGTKVTLKDTHKKTVGVATLDEGTWTAAITGGDFVTCQFPFSLKVPTSRAYAVQIAKRKAGTVSAKALVANDWVLSIRLS